MFQSYISLIITNTQQNDVIAVIIAVKFQSYISLIITNTQQNDVIAVIIAVKFQSYISLIITLYFSAISFHLSILFQSYISLIITRYRIIIFHINIKVLLFSIISAESSVLMFIYKDEHDV